MSHTHVCNFKLRDFLFCNFILVFPQIFKHLPSHIRDDVLQGIMSQKKSKKQTHCELKFQSETDDT